MLPGPMRLPILRSRLLLAILAGALLSLPAVARAGSWIQVSCVNPDGSPAGEAGWSSFSVGGPGYGSNTSTLCAPGSPMAAYLSDQAAAPTGAQEVLQYTPPAGSTLAGGTVDVALAAHGSGYNASGTAVLYEPAFQYDGSDVFFQCASGLSACSASGAQYSGTLALPNGRGGNFYLGAGCGGDPGAQCNATPNANGTWGSADLYWANFLLTNNAAPTGTGFSGGLLQGNASGTVGLVFTAADPGGPGVFAVAVLIDGRGYYLGTPDTYGGTCVPVGHGAGGAPMFDASQPCPPSEVADLSIPTGALADGRHRLQVEVIDAAGNSSTVLDETITTRNHATVLRPRARRRHIHARITISWTWRSARTRLERIAFAGLPRGARVTVRCAGRGCPAALRAGPTLSPRAAERALAHRRFRAGDRIYLTVTAGSLVPERALVRIRAGRLPAAGLL
jgi:hypothetical protein